MEANRTTPEPLDMSELVNLELKEQESTVDKSESAIKAEYVRKWREEHKEKIKEYNRRYYNKQRDESNDFYSVVRELRAFKLKHDKLDESVKELTNKVVALYELQLNPTSKLKVELEPEIILDLEKQEKPVPPSQKSSIPDILENTERTPTQSPATVVPEIKKIKKIRKVKVKPPVSPTFSVTSVESNTAPTKFTKNLINEVLDDLIDSDGNIIMSESD